MGEQGPEVAVGDSGQAGVVGAGGPEVVTAGEPTTIMPNPGTLDGPGGMPPMPPQIMELIAMLMGSKGGAPGGMPGGGSGVVIPGAGPRKAVSPSGVASKILSPFTTPTSLTNPSLIKSLMGRPKRKGCSAPSALKRGRVPNPPGPSP